MAQSKRRIEGDQTVHYVSARKKREPAPPKMQPPLTPMIDVTFQLLLFFLLVTRFPNEAIIPGSIPQKGVSITPDPTQTKTVDVIVRQSGEGESTTPEYAIRAALEQPISPAGGGDYEQQLAEGLHLALKDLVAARGEDVHIVIKPEIDRTQSTYVKWQYVVQAYNQARRAKIKNVGFAYASLAERGTF
jgi:biopolymer transport protein ExbD